MTGFTVDGMRLIITIGKIKANKKYVYPSLVILVEIRSDSLLGSPARPHDDYRQIGIVFTNMVMKVSVTGKVEDGENIVIGYARPESLQWEIKGSVNNIDFILMLDHYILAQVEKFRENDNLYLQLDLRAQGYAMEKPGQIHEHELSRERITVSKSDWVEEILPELNYKNVTLIEVPVLESKDFSDVIAEVDNAWKEYSMGDYKQVLGHCRNALEGIATKIKEAGFEMQDNEEEYMCPKCGHIWSKLEHYRETHEAIFRYKSDDAKKNELSRILIDIGQSLKNNNSIEITKILPQKDKVKTAATTNTATAGTKSATTTTISPIDPISFKFLYAKENQKLEIHMELEWTPK